MTLIHKPLKLQQSKRFLVAIDSDGCVFDTMEVKHKECFCPVTIRHFRLQAASRYARDAWEFVNLYSRLRGTNRFPALIAVMDLLRDRAEVQHRNIVPPVLNELRKWIRTESKLGNPALRMAASGSEELTDVLKWSEEVNRAVDAMVHGVPPFPQVHACLEKAAGLADMMVASSTPRSALQREWTEHGLARFVQVIAGQETGSKTEQLTNAAAAQYAPDCMLMIGDAFGDYKAARNVGACFYPILPGDEESSWERLLTDALDLFVAGQYRGPYEEARIRELRAVLPNNPTWD